MAYPEYVNDNILINPSASQMLPLSIILGIILATHITAYPIFDDHSSLAQDKALDWAIAAEVFNGDQYEGQPRDQPQDRSTVQPIVQPRQQPSIQLAPFPEVPPTQSCHIKENWLWNSYTVLIRIAYRNAADCDATYHALESWTTSVTDWKCINKDGFIQLTFNVALFHDSDVDSALNSRYPTVAGGFNCPRDE